jgi:iron complex outermembrane receptor protein
MLDFIGFDQHDSSRQKTWDVSGNLSGELFEVGGGPLGVALGVEYRDLFGRFDPDPIVAAGFSSDIPAQPTRGGYNSKEAYAEFNAPFFRNAPGADLFEVSAAVRYSKYKTDSGNSFAHTTFKAAANWKPIKAVRFRGSWAQGFRAPSIGELFGSLSRFDSAIDDPCSVFSGQTRNFLSDATVRANCLSQGVPAAGSQTQPTDQLSVITGGNENLEPETSRSFVFGGVVSPDFLPGFSAEMNWYDIKVKGAIQSISATTTLFRCVLENDPLACGNVSRSAGTGNVTAIQGTLQNIAGIKTEGLDLNFAYRTPLPNMGTVGLTWNNVFLRKFDVFTPTATGIAVEHRAGVETGSPSQGYPRWKSIGIVDWNGFGFGATLTGRYVSKLREILNNDSPLKATFYTDAQLRWSPKFNFFDELGVAVGVNNLFNVKTPGCFSCDTNNMDPTTYDPPGRYYYARIGVKM